MENSALAMASLIAFLCVGLGSGMGLVVGIPSPGWSSTQPLAPASGTPFVSERQTSGDRDLPVSSEEGKPGLETAIAIAVLNVGYITKPLARRSATVKDDHDVHGHGQRREVGKDSQAAAGAIFLEATAPRRRAAGGRPGDGERGEGGSLSLKRLLSVPRSVISRSWSSRVSDMMMMDIVATSAGSPTTHSSVSTTSLSSSSSSLATSSSSARESSSSSPRVIPPERPQRTARRLLRVDKLLQEWQPPPAAPGNSNSDNGSSSVGIFLAIGAVVVVGIILSLLIKLFSPDECSEEDDIQCAGGTTGRGITAGGVIGFGGGGGGGGGG